MQRHSLDQNPTPSAATHKIIGILQKWSHIPEEQGVRAPHQAPAMLGTMLWSDRTLHLSGFENRQGLCPRDADGGGKPRLLSQGLCPDVLALWPGAKAAVWQVPRPRHHLRSLSVLRPCLQRSAPQDCLPCSFPWRLASATLLCTQRRSCGGRIRGWNRLALHPGLLCLVCPRTGSQWKVLFFCLLCP